MRNQIRKVRMLETATELKLPFCKYGLKKGLFGDSSLSFKKKKKKSAWLELISSLTICFIVFLIGIFKAR